MTSKRRSMNITIVSCIYLVLFSAYFGSVRAQKINKLSLRNATDSLILLTELATESGGDYVLAKADHIEMLNGYIQHMKSRHNPQWSENSIIEELKSILKRLKEDGKEADQQMEARLKIGVASEAMVELLSKYELFVDEPIVSFKPGIILKEMQAAVRNLFDEAHEKTQIYVSDVNMVNSETAYRANRKAMVYLYLIRFEWLEIIDSERLKNFRGDINRTIFWNRILENSEISEEERLRLTKCSANEFRHLRLLHAITSNDMKEVHVWLKLATKEAFPDVQFLAER